MCVCPASLSLFSFFLSLSFSIPSLPPPLPTFLLSLCSTVFILLQPPCFCGAVSVVDTMKTGRIHYLALHSSHPLWFSLPAFPLSSLLLSTMNTFFHHTIFFFTPPLSLSRFVMLHFLLPWLVFISVLFCSMHLSANDWLILTIYPSLHLATCWSHPPCTAFMLLPKLMAKNNHNSVVSSFCFLSYRHSEKLLFLQKEFKLAMLAPPTEGRVGWIWR